MVAEAPNGFSGSVGKRVIQACLTLGVSSNLIGDTSKGDYMSFIPSRDVFNMSPEEVEKLDKIYDEIEAKYLDDFAEDEFGVGWTFEKVRKEPRYKHWYPIIGGYDMLVYLMNREEWNAKRNEDSDS